MVKDDLRETAGTDDETRPPRVGGRRQFLKGTSLALPAVMTLHIQSVSAQAAGTFFGCTQNGAGEIVAGVIRGTDGCAREPVSCFNNGTVAIFFDPYADSNAGAYRTIPNGEVHSTGGGGLGPEWVACDGANGPGDVDGPYPSEMYALVRYDENYGFITTLGVSGDRVNGFTGAAGIAASAGGACWASVRGSVV
jgi:hypothetical protein